MLLRQSDLKLNRGSQRPETISSPWSLWTHTKQVGPLAYVFKLLSFHRKPGGQSVSTKSAEISRWNQHLVGSKNSLFVQNDSCENKVSGATWCDAEVAKRKSTVSESRQTRKSSSLGTSKTKDLGTTTADMSNSSQYQSRLTRRSALESSSKSKIVPEGSSRRSSRVQELRLEHDDEGSSSRLSKQR